MRSPLDEEHYGLDKVKRTIEFLVVRQLKKDPKGSILCLWVPGCWKDLRWQVDPKTMAAHSFAFFGRDAR